MRLTADHVVKLLVILIAILLWPLLFGQGGVFRMMELTEELQILEADNQEANARNLRIAAEVASLRGGLDAIEERARYDLNMVRPGEVLFRIQRPQKAIPGSAIPADIINDPLYRPAPVTPPEGTSETKGADKTENLPKPQ